jgi:sulfur carrier protein ThiS adenylyltransferase
MLLDTCSKYFPDTYYIGASGVAGYGDLHPVCVKKLGQKVYIVGDMATDSRSTYLTAGKVGLVAHTQANLAMKLLLA